MLVRRPRPGFIPTRFRFVPITPWSEIWISPRPLEPPISCTLFRFRRALRKATCQPAISFWQVRLAGWGAKQWPLEYYSELAQGLRRDFGLPLVLNTAQPVDVEGVWKHVSGLPGLIHATRKATAVVGIDSGPTHLAAALGKAGVAIYGPTDPARHGPYGDSFTVLRSASANTSYRRSADPDPSMRAISAEQVMQALAAKLSAAKTNR